jgi:hypothetical protein
MVMAKVKVSQSTIDKIKAMGMTKALKGASKANPEMKEALTRMYGARRVSAAMPSKPVARSADAARSGTMKVAKPVAKSADAARMGAKPAMSKSAAKPVKKSGTTDPFARAVFGVAKAITSGQGAQRMTAAQVAAENKRRIAAAAKKNK